MNMARRIMRIHARRRTERPSPDHSHAGSTGQGHPIPRMGTRHRQANARLGMMRGRQRGIRPGLPSSEAKEGSH